MLQRFGQRIRNAGKVIFHAMEAAADRHGITIVIWINIHAGRSGEVLQQHQRHPFAVELPQIDRWKKVQADAGDEPPDGRQDWIARAIGIDREIGDPKNGTCLIVLSAEVADTVRDA